jgi:CRP/FNR family transcriptional regulator
MARSRIETLRALDLFDVLDPSRLETLAKTAVANEYGPGDVLFLEGEPCQGLWIIGEGAAQIVKTTPQGRQLVLGTQTAPSTVAEVPVFDGGPYPASVIAVHPTWAILLPKREFLALCHAQPDLALHFLKTFGRRLRHLVGLAERVTFGTIRQRLALDLLERANLLGADSFQTEETQEQWAGRLGTVREVISRNLNRFQTEGLVRLERRRLAILDRPGLENEAATEM